MTSIQNLSPTVDENGDPVFLTEADFVDPEKQWTPELVDEHKLSRAMEERYNRQTEALISRLWDLR